MSAAVRFVDIGSPLDGVPASSWRRYVDELETQPHNVISRHGGIGIYDTRPRRLVEIGRAANFRRQGGKQLCDFILPWTEKRFLADPVAQYAVLVKSMRLYYDALRRGDIKRPEGVSMAGALTILHCGGRSALKGWPKLFKGTKALYEATKGMF